MSLIITIGREFGSGGRELGKRLAEELGIAYYDKEVISEIAKKTSIAYDYVQTIVEKKPIDYMPITIGSSFASYSGNSEIIRTNNVIRQEQTNVIKDLASKSDCVIVGRCADYILEDMNPFKIFVYSDMESKIKRCRAKGKVDDSISDKKLAKMIKKIDKQRSQYYEYYTSRNWGDRSNYDICINTSSKVIKDVEKALINIFKK